MENKHMRSLTEQELQTIYGGNIFKSIWNWIKEHIFLETSGDPNARIRGGVRF
jgi:bacteriocin-like protein